jgi:hypothetical protein
VRLFFDRRGFLQALGGFLAGLVLPVRAFGHGLWDPVRSWLAVAPRFFDDHERATLEALCDRIVPPDSDPGARALGAAAYIENLLTAFDLPVPRLFARGPFSGRNPYPNPGLGTPSPVHPPDLFRASIRPSRVQELYWRAEILGSAAAGLPPHLDAQRGGPLVGLRDLYRAALAKVDQVAQSTFGLAFVDLTPAQQDQVFTAVDRATVFPPDPLRDGRSFVDLLIGHTLEGCFAPPEYGGNADAEGWRMIGLEGDSQPLGYSLYSQRTHSYRERPDHPMSTPNPDELAADGSLSPRPLSPDGAEIQHNITTFSRLLESLFPGSMA